MKRLTMTAALALLLASGCGEAHERHEGAEPGDCSDGADNDIDGLFDCDDPGCGGAPACAGRDAALPRLDGSIRFDGAPGAADAGPPLPDGGPERADGATSSGGDGSVEGSDGGPLEGHTFPARDLVCAPSATPPCSTDTPARTDAERTTSLPPSTGPRTLVYLLDTLSIPVAAGGQAVGFNLDAMDSGEGSDSSDAACDAYFEDYRGLYDPAHVGVDNRYQSLIPTIESIIDPEDCPDGETMGCIDALIQESINDGDMLILVEVEGVDDLTYDPSVQVSLYEGSGTPAISGGRPAPGQTFGTASMLATAEGDIFAGRLRVRLPRLPLDLQAGSSGFGITPLYATELRADVSAENLTRGHFGGLLSVDELVAMGEAANPGTGESLRSAYESIADVDPSPDPLICERVSIAMALTGVPAARTP